MNTLPTPVQAGLLIVAAMALLALACVALAVYARRAQRRNRARWPVTVPVWTLRRDDRIATDHGPLLVDSAPLLLGDGHVIVVASDPFPGKGRRRFDWRCTDNVTLLDRARTVTP